MRHTQISHTDIIITRRMFYGDKSKGEKKIERRIKREERKWPISATEAKTKEEIDRSQKLRQMERKRKAGKIVPKALDGQRYPCPA